MTFFGVIPRKAYRIRSLTDSLLKELHFLWVDVGFSGVVSENFVLLSTGEAGWICLGPLVKLLAGAFAG